MLRDQSNPEPLRWIARTYARSISEIIDLRVALMEVQTKQEFVNAFALATYFELVKGPSCGLSLGPSEPSINTYTSVFISLSSSLPFGAPVVIWLALT